MNSTVSKEKINVYATILSSPGMDQQTKISMQISRQQIVLFCRLIEVNLSAAKRDPEDLLLQAMPPEIYAGLKSISEELLHKAGLETFYAKLQQL
jgi:hypothetical protein